MAKKEPKFPYTTFNGLTVDVNKDEDEHVLTIAGDRVKELKRGNFGVVMAEAQKVWAMYEERRAVEA